MTNVPEEQRQFDISFIDGLAGVLFIVVFNFALTIIALQLVYLTIFSTVNLDYFANLRFNISRQELTVGFAVVFIVLDLVLMPILFKGAAAFLNFSWRWIATICSLWVVWQMLTVYTLWKLPSQWPLFLNDAFDLVLLLLFLFKSFGASSAGERRR